MSKLRNVYSQWDSNPGSLDCTSGILPPSLGPSPSCVYRAQVKSRVIEMCNLSTTRSKAAILNTVGHIYLKRSTLITTNLR